jgi:hypothetical protein
MFSLEDCKILSKLKVQNGCLIRNIGMAFDVNIRIFSNENLSNLCSQNLGTMNLAVDAERPGSGLNESRSGILLREVPGTAVQVPVSLQY